MNPKEHWNEVYQSNGNNNPTITLPMTPSVPLNRSGQQILRWRKCLTALLAFGFVGATAILLLAQPAGPTSAALPAGKAAEPTNEIATLRAEIERLKGLVPDQAHAMKDVGYHFANLWFAGQKTNWPLAEFYWAETRSHLRWALRIIPVRKDPQGNEIRLTEILDPIDKTSLQQVGDAIKAKDNMKFVEAYKQMLDSCYACHLATGKAFLRLQIPQQPEAPIIKFDAAP